MEAPPLPGAGQGKLHRVWELGFRGSWGTLMLSDYGTLRTLLVSCFLACKVRIKNIHLWEFLRRKRFTTGNVFGTEPSESVPQHFAHCTEGPGLVPVQRKKRRERTENNGGKYFNILRFALPPSAYGLLFPRSFTFPRLLKLQPSAPNSGQQRFKNARPKAPPCS